MKLVCGFIAALPVAATACITVPQVPFKSSDGSFSLHNAKSIIVDSRHADATDTDGQTLIPPTLSEFAHVFQKDLKSTLQIDLPIVAGDASQDGSIFITLDQDKAKFVDVAGRYTSEGYQLDIDNGIVISGASPLGSWWATRSILQIATLNNATLEHGSTVDSPSWSNRGFMLDGGRHYYPPEFVVEMCAYLSYFKQNTLQLHMSDNLNNYPSRYSHERTLSLYAAFRPWSDDPTVAGLNTRRNESYTRDDMDKMQQDCAARGVTIIPEIEAPGHALAIVKWKPQIGLADLSMLNISHPDTIPTMKTIWSTFLPWFHSKVVHIGADEYDDAHIKDYARFVNEMASFILEESGKSIRVWGTFTPKQGSDVSKNVTMQHWANYDDNAYWDFIKNGYQVINAYNYFYAVNKYSAAYPPPLKKTKAFTGTPDGSQFSPNIFDVKNASNNAARNNPNVHGHLVSLWNDWGPNGTTVLEAFHALRDALPALADKQWGGNLTETQYDNVMVKLQAAVPGQNLERKIKSKTSTILKYKFSQCSNGKGHVKDHSGNNYHGKIVGDGCVVKGKTMTFSGDCMVKTPLGSKGRDYTLSFSVNPAEYSGSLFDGPDSRLTFDHDNITMISGGNYYTIQYSLPKNTWTDVQLIREQDRTFFQVNGAEKIEFKTILGIWGQALRPERMAFEAPLATIGDGFKGQMSNVTLANGT